MPDPWINRSAHRMWSHVVQTTAESGLNDWSQVQPHLYSELNTCDQIIHGTLVPGVNRAYIIFCFLIQRKQPFHSQTMTQYKFCIFHSILNWIAEPLFKVNSTYIRNLFGIQLPLQLKHNAWSFLCTSWVGKLAPQPTHCANTICLARMSLTCELLMCSLILVQKHTQWKSVRRACLQPWMGCMWELWLLFI